MPIEYAAKAWKNNILDNFSTSTRPANLTGCISTGQTDKQVLCIICILRNCPMYSCSVFHDPYLAGEIVDGGHFPVMGLLVTTKHLQNPIRLAILGCIKEN